MAEEIKIGYLPTLMDMGYLNKPLKIYDVFYTNAIDRVHPINHHYDNPGMLR